MKKLRKGLSIFLAVLLIVMSVSSFSAFAEPRFELFAYDGSAQPGTTARVSVHFKNYDNKDLLGFKVIVRYDENMLTPLSVEPGSQITGGLQDNIDGDATPGCFCVYWAGSEAKVFEHIWDSPVFTIDFFVKENTQGHTYIYLECSQEDTFDDDFNDVAITPYDVDLIIGDIEEGEHYSNADIVGSTGNNSWTNSINVNGGEEFDVTLILRSANLAYIELYGYYVFLFDSETFEYVGVYRDDRRLSEDETEGNVIVSEGSVAINMSDDVSFYIDFIRLRCKDTARRGTYQINGAFRDSNIPNYEFSPLTVNVVSISKNQAAEINIPDGLFARAGQTITVPVTISNNYGVMGYKLNVAYNPQHLEAVSATSAIAGNFDDTIGQREGSFYALWNSTQDNFTNGALMYITFNVLTDVELESEISLSYSQSDTFNEVYDDVLFNCNNNSVYLNCSHGVCTSETVGADCENYGYTEYTCQKCSESYRDSFASAIGHLYRCNRDFSTKTFTYYCEDCNKRTTKNVSELEAIWGIQYINVQPKRTIVDDSCYLDVVQDDIVNAKDFAAIQRTAEYAE